MLEPFFVKRWEWLAEYNIEIARTMLQMMGIERELRVSESYVEATPEDVDLRGKKCFLASTFDEPLRPYTQVFSDRLDFEAGLSIIDLFFCEGPYASQLLCP